MRLVNHHREKIAQAAVKAAFADREAAHAEFEAAIAQDVYNHAVPAVQRADMAKLPLKYFEQASSFRVTVGGQYFRLKASAPMSIPYCISDVIAKFLPDDALGLRVSECVIRRDELKEERNKAQRTTYQMLCTFHTVEKLREGWPDGAPFYAEIDTLAPIKTLPAVVVADVNKLLGLPKAA